MLKNPDPDDEEYKETIEWLGGNYNPEHFAPGEVHFDNPEERFKMAFDLWESITYKRMVSAVLMNMFSY